MNEIEASEKSGINVSYKIKDDGYAIFFNGQEYWTETPGGKVKKFGGNVGKNGEWLPLEISVNELFEVWTTKKGRGDSIKIEKSWRDAVNISPYSMAVRITNNGSRMYRLHDGTTYNEFPNSFIKQERVTADYDGWESVDNDTPHVSILSEKLKTGRPEKIYKIDTFKKEVPNPSAPSIPVSDEALKANVLVSNELGKTARALIVAGKFDDARKITEQLLKLSNQMSWLLRENRGQYLPKKNDEIFYDQRNQ